MYGVSTYRQVINRFYHFLAEKRPDLFSLPLPSLSCSPFLPSPLAQVHTLNIATVTALNFSRWYSEPLPASRPWHLHLMEPEDENVLGTWRWRMVEQAHPGCEDPGEAAQGRSHGLYCLSHSWLSWVQLPEAQTPLHRHACLYLSQLFPGSFHPSFQKISPHPLPFHVMSISS